MTFLRDRATGEASKVSLTAVVVTFRRPTALDRTLRSLAEQTYTRWTAIVCDDGSADGTEDVVAAWANRDSRFRPLTADRNVGMPANLNRGLRQVPAGRDIVVVHDADIYRPDAFERFRAALDSWPQAGLVFCQYAAHDADGLPVPRNVEHFPEFTRGEEFLRDHFLRRWSFGSPVHGAAAIRHEALSDAGLPDPRFAHLADVDLWMRICERWGVAFVDSPLISLATRASAPQDWGTSGREDRRLTRRIFLESRLRQTEDSPLKRAVSLAQHGAFTAFHETYYTAAEIRGWRRFDR